MKTFQTKSFGRKNDSGEWMNTSHLTPPTQVREVMTLITSKPPCDTLARTGNKANSFIMPGKVAVAGYTARPPSTFGKSHSKMSSSQASKC